MPSTGFRASVAGLAIVRPLRRQVSIALGREVQTTHRPQIAERTSKNKTGVSRLVGTMVTHGDLWWIAA
jgi:hypothetical protein